ncbi:MAG: HEAT repeat domain-containing protein [Anaerovoracaceae bacterium]
MGFYDLTKEERRQRYEDIQVEIFRGLKENNILLLEKYFDNDDTYIRKAAYLAVGKIYKAGQQSKDKNIKETQRADEKNDTNLIRKKLICSLEKFMDHRSAKVRQTAVNAAGEIAIVTFANTEKVFELGLLDQHHSVRNAVQGSLKKSGEKNPQPVIEFCNKHINSEQPEVRRQVAHGLELRGRTHPEEVMPTLRKLQFEKHKRVRPMLIHIFGQISYKKGCLEKVTDELLTWEDKGLADDCFEEIIKQHRHIDNHFRTVETLSPEECEAYIIKRRRL